MIAIPEELNLRELVGQDTLDRLQALFECATGVPVVFADARGQALTEIKEPLRFCGALVTDPENRTMCLRRKKWDVPEPEIEQKLRDRHRTGEPVSHRCRGGFRDTAAPIVVEDQIIGYGVFARTMVKDPDRERFRRLAAEAGMEESVGEQIADITLVRSQEEIEETAEFLQLIAELVARAAYDQIRAQQVTELQEDRDKLIQMIVHDLRTPLTSIMSSLQTIRDTDYDPEITEEFVPMAIEGSEELLELINTILEINRMESGQLELELEETDLQEVAAEALQSVRSLAEERGHEMINSVPADLPAIEADVDLLERLAVNLLGNAVKFTEDNGRIEIGAEDDGDGVRLWVKDNGPGIAEDRQQTIFEKFGSVGAKEKSEQSTGLGLTFCRMVTEAHGGEIWVDSEVGEGSTFSVWLPLSPPDEDEDEVAPDLDAKPLDE